MGTEPDHRATGGAAGWITRGLRAYLEWLLPRTLTLDDLADTSEVGDWKMPNFRMACCSYAASPGWLIVEDDMLTMTTAGLRAAQVAGLTRGRRRVVNPFERHAEIRRPAPQANQRRSTVSHSVRNASAVPPMAHRPDHRRSAWKSVSTDQ